MNVFSFALPVFGAVVVASGVSLTAPERKAPTASLTAQSAVAPTPLELGPSAAPLAAVVEGGQVAAAAETAAQARAAKTKAAQIRAADDRARQQRATQQRASRSRSADRSSSSDPKSIAREVLSSRGQSGQFSCLDKLWERESGWSVSAENDSSGAYGIPQSLPGSKMASTGDDWRTSARTQISWGLTYIDGRYGSPCSAWSHSESNGWY